MATYKVIQDIEAEDKLLGPLTLKQFIYAGIAVVSLYVCFLALTKHAAFLLVVFLPVALAAGFFAWPWSLNQPTEVWALAKIRFLLKPRKRIWDQSGTKDLVTVTAPKRVENNFVKDLSQTEVKSRLRVLADTIDSRGWAIKNVSVNMYGQAPTLLNSQGSDRLIDVSSLPQEVSAVDVRADDDILDPTSNAVAQHFDQMVHAASDAHRQQILSQLHQAAASGLSNSPATPPNDYWFLSQNPTPTNLAPGYTTFGSQVVAPGSSDSTNSVTPTADEAALVHHLKTAAVEPEISYGHLRTIQPLDPAHRVPVPPVPAPPAAATTTDQPPVTQTPDPAILGLATDNDKNIATIARMANNPHQSQPPTDEVVISLH